MMLAEPHFESPAGPKGHGASATPIFTAGLFPFMGSSQQGNCTSAVTRREAHVSVAGACQPRRGAQSSESTICPPNTPPSSHTLRSHQCVRSLGCPLTSTNPTRSLRIRRQDSTLNHRAASTSAMGETQGMKKLLDHPANSIAGNSKCPEKPTM
jgi:hypothetical protein